MQDERERLTARSCHALDCETVSSYTVMLPIGKVLRFCQRCADGYARTGELPFLEERRDYWSTPPAIEVIRKIEPALSMLADRPPNCGTKTRDED